MDVNNLKVPVKGEDGKTIMEDWNQSGPQSDGSQYFMPKKLISDDHEHFFEKKKPEDRIAACECGFGGEIYPHNSILKNGHIYDLKGNKMA